MLRYITSRLLQGIVVIILISIITFVIMRLMPGDPTSFLLGEDSGVRISEEQIQAIKARWGLDRPYHEQYFLWVRNMFLGNMGESIRMPGTPVSDLIWRAVPVTAELNLYAFLIATLVSLPVGIMGALRRNSAWDYGTSIGSALGIAMPNFWLGLMLIIIFAVYLEWLPPYGLNSWHGYILPVIVLATEQTAVLTRVMRGAMMDVLNQDYVRTARAKGLREYFVILNHAARNALLPVITVIGVRIAFLLSGTIVVETVFAVPGIGRLLTESVFRLDYQVVQSLFVLLAILVVAVNLLTDLVYAFIDPRIRVE